MTIQTLRWQLYDPALSATFIFPMNPNQMNSPFRNKNMNLFGEVKTSSLSGHTTTVTTQTLAYQKRADPVQFQFQGIIHTKDDHDALLFWAQKKNRLHLTDHLSRTWEVSNISFQVTFEHNPRRPWRGQYEIKMLLYGAV